MAAGRLRAHTASCRCRLLGDLPCPKTNVGTGIILLRLRATWRGTEQQGPSSRKNGRLGRSRFGQLLFETIFVTESCLTPCSGAPQHRSAASLQLAMHQLYALALFAGFCVVMAHGQELRWREQAPLPLPRSGYMTGVVDGKMIVAGGTYWENKQKLWTARADALDPVTNAWRELASLPEPRGDAASVSHKNVLYLIGGGVQGTALRETLAFRKGMWASLAGAELPEPRLHAVALQWRNSIYLIGGMSKAGDYSSATMSLWVWKPNSPQKGWRELPPLPGAGRIGHAAVEAGGKIYVFGGAVAAEQGVRNLDDACEFDLQTGRWTALPRLPVARRFWWGVTLGDRILLLGGYTNTYESEIYEYDRPARMLRRIGALPKGLSDARFVRIRDWLVGTGGEAAPQVRGPWTFQVQLPAEWRRRSESRR